MTKASNNRRAAVILTIVIILTVAIATIFIFRSIYSNNAQPEPDSSTTQATTTDETADSSTAATDATEPDHTATDDTPLQYEGADPNTSTVIEAVLTYYGIQNGEYIVNVNIPQYLSGTCQITLGDYTGSVAIDQSAASSACSFHIPTNRLQSGLQPLKVIIQSHNATGAIEENIDVNL